MSSSIAENAGYPQSTSSGWLARLQSRDAGAWQRLTQDYGRLVYAWCRQRGLSAEEAGDVSQNVFLEVAAHIAAFERQRTGSFRNWLRTITHNKVMDHFRRRGQPEAAGGSDAQQFFNEVPESVSSESEVGERILLLRAVLERIRPEFTEQSWTAFWRLTIDGHSSTDIATDLGMKPEAVRQSKTRILRRLRSELDEHPDAPGA